MVKVLVFMSRMNTCETAQAIKVYTSGKPPKYHKEVCYFCGETMCMPRPNSRSSHSVSSLKRELIFFSCTSV